MTTDRCEHGVRYPHPCRTCEDGPMTVDEIYERKRSLQARIREYIIAFERETGVPIIGVDLLRQPIGQSEQLTVLVRIPQ